MNRAGWALVFGGVPFAGLVYFMLSGGPGVPLPSEGALAVKALGCLDDATLSRAQERLNTNNDWMPAAGLVVQGQCVILDPGATWRLIERGNPNSLVYAKPKAGGLHRVYVRNSKLREQSP